MVSLGPFMTKLLAVAVTEALLLLGSSGIGHKTDLGDDVSTFFFSNAALSLVGVEREEVLPFCADFDAAKRRLVAITDDCVSVDLSGGRRGGGGGGSFFIFFCE